MKTAQISAYSRRSDFGAADPLYARLRALAASRPRVLDLTFSNPARAGVDVPHPLELLKTAPPDYSPDPRGLLRARTALSEAYAGRARTTPDQFLLTASTSEAYAFALCVLCDPGDKILVPRPSYPLFAQLAQIAGVKLISYQIAYDGAFHADLASLPTRAQIRSLGIKALFVVSPNNPTGNCLRQEELSRFRELSIPLLIDEVFRPYSGASTHSGAQTLCDPLRDAEEHPLCVVVDGLSKRAAAPGLKLGWMLALGSESQNFLERAEWVSDAYLSAGSLVQHALPEILKREIDIQRNVKERLRENRHLLGSSDLSSTGITELRTEGGFTALLRFPSTSTEAEWWQDLSAEGIWLWPGHLYDLGQTPTFAVSLLTPPDVLSDALSLMKRLVQSRT